PQPLAATASSGFPVTFTVLNGPATIVEGGLFYTGAGTVLVRAAQPGSDEYNPAPNVDHTITVAPKKLVVTATTVSRSYGDANPALDLTYEGFADGDSASDLDSAPVASTTATETSDVGSYPITVMGGTDNNYTFSYVAGSLTITPRAQSI